MATPELAYIQQILDAAYDSGQLGRASGGGLTSRLRQQHADTKDVLRAAGFEGRLPEGYEIDWSSGRPTLSKTPRMIPGTRLPVKHTALTLSAPLATIAAPHIIGQLGGGAGGAGGTTAGGAAGGAGAGGSSIWGTLAGGAGVAGRAVGGATSAAAANRGSTLQAATLDDEARRRALRDIGHAQYIQNAQGYTPRAGLPSFGFGPTAPTDTERSSAAELERVMMDRLRNGLPGMKPGLLERIGNVAAPILTGAGAIADARRKKDE